MAAWVSYKVHVSVVGRASDLDIATHVTVSLIFFVYRCAGSCDYRKSEK